MEKFTSAKREEVQQFSDGRILPSMNNGDVVMTPTQDGDDAMASIQEGGILDVVVLRVSSFQL